LAAQYPDMPFRLVAISRDMKTILPGGGDVIHADDKVFVMSKPQDVERIFGLAGKPATASRDVMLMGGGMIGRITAEELERDKIYRLKLVERDDQNAQRAMQRLQNTMVVRSNTAADFDVLTIEGLGEMGVFAALTDDDENNIVTSLFARHLGVKRTITLIGKPEYMPVVRAIGLDAAINLKILTSDAVLKYLLGGRILAVTSLVGIEAEIIDFAVSEKSRAAGRRIRDIHFPAGSIVGAIDHQGDVSVAVGDTRVEPGDRLVVFCEQRAAPKLEKLFG
jgi:trk system potassium uptake protein TrkA